MLTSLVFPDTFCLQETPPSVSPQLHPAMSHKYPYRPPPSDTDLRPDPGPFSSSDRRHASSRDRDSHRTPQESFSPSYPPSSTTSSRGSAPWSQDGALSILTSCGLEPSDLSLLAELPEDVLTLESLPHVLNQIKVKRGTVKPVVPSAPSSSHPSSSAYPPASCSADWDQLRRQPVQYPLDQITPSALPSGQVQDRWGNVRTSSSARVDRPSSSSSTSSSSSFYAAGTDRRPGLSEYGKTGRATGHVSSQDRASFRSTGRAEISCPYRISEHGSAAHSSVPPTEQYHLQPRGSHVKPEASSIRSSRYADTSTMPSKSEALDFHGTPPQVYPYSCSLCDITVLSERVWIKHINGTQHADGQLSLLQQFPKWDCRMETVSRADVQSERQREEEKPPQPTQTANQSQKPQPNKQPQKKASDKGKVVCAKFPPQSVDETYLRKLAEPFGKIVKVLMFPSLAFVELGSVDQAKDLVKFHSNYPPTVNGEQIEFSISNTFSFLQSSQVVSFTPPPTGEDGKSDLISIIKRFGPPLYTLFLPSAAFVEMKNAPDAQKLVDYYSSNTLRINSDLIRVAFSGEYKSLMRVTSAQRFEDEAPSTKRTRNPSQDKDETTETKRKRSGSKDRAEEEGSTTDRKTRIRSRSRSKDKSSRDKRSLSKSRDKNSRDKRSRSRSKSRDKTSREKRSRSRSKSKDKTSRDKRSRSRSKSKDKTRENSSKENRTRSRSRSKDKSTSTDQSSKEFDRESRHTRSRSKDKSSSMSPRQTTSSETMVEPGNTEEPDSKPRTDTEPDPDSKHEPADQELSEEEAESSAEDSDIEGMEVIGEDGENLEDDDDDDDDDDDMETMEEEEGVEVEAEPAEENNCPAETCDSPEDEKEKDVKDGGTHEQEEEETLEEQKEEEQEDEEKQEEKEEEQEVEEKQRENKEKPEEDEASETAREPEETAETQEDDEEESGFPVDLENCITLDELDEDQSDDAELRDEPQSPTTRVIYFTNLPQRFYTDAEFVKLVRGFGKAARYFLIRRQRQGFIEMSSSSEAWRAAQELSSKPVIFHGSRLVVNISHKYCRLTNGYEVHLDPDEEKKSERHSRGSRRSEKWSKSTTSDRDETCRRSESTKRTPEKESRSTKSMQKELANRNSSGNMSETSSRQSPENESEVRNTSEKPEDKESNSKKPTDKESLCKETEDDSAPDKSPEDKLLLNTSPEKETSERKVSHKDESTEKTLKKEMDQMVEDTPEDMEVSEAETSVTVVQDSETSLDQPESSDPPNGQTTQNDDDDGGDDHNDDDHLQEFDDMEQKPEPAAAEPQEPTKPVGTEFVRPVVGYFCNLCQVIYADEDEAKQQHCSSLTHYRKYQEKTGRDPWTS